MKKALCLILSLVTLLGFSACSQQQDERAGREVVLTYPSKPAEDPSQPEEEEPEEDIDLTKDFEVIPRLSELPDTINTNPKLYARILENILKIYYSGLLSGRINSDVYQHRMCTDKLPDKNASAQERQKLAEYCTVGGALEYFGYDNRNYMKYYEMFNGCLWYFRYDRDANIYPESESSSENTLAMTDFDQSLYFIFRFANIDRVERDALTYIAQEVNSAVSEYYNGIKDGSVTSSTKLHHTSDNLPQPKSTQEERTALAKQATIAGAVDYYRFYTPSYPCITSLGYNKKSELFTLPDFNDPDIIALSSPETKLSVIFPS